MPYSYDPEAAGLIPEGVHTLTVVAVDETTTRSDGTPMWIVRLEDDQNREVTEWIKQTPKVIDWKLKPLWEAAGLQWPTRATVIDEQDLVDKRVQATITHREDPQYGRQAQADGYTQPGTSDIPDGQEAFTTGDIPVTSGTRGYGQPDDDDIPF